MERTVTDNPVQESLIARMRSRRVTREFTADAVTEAQLRLIVEGGRWASSASNIRIHKYVLVTDQDLIDRLRVVSPGIYGRPPALIVICTDLQRCRAVGLEPKSDRSSYVDVGTSLMNMLLIAQDLRLGACPVTSFSQRAASVLLDLPESLIPELLVLVGHPAPRRRVVRAGAPASLTVEDLTFIATRDRGLQPLSLNSRSQ
ncbi:MAG: nitroreductase [Chloroflexi bacterium]|nr:nitroreductase [Chloroflexota bacterium]